MWFWITASFIILIIAVVASYGPYFGLYGDVEKKEEKQKWKSHG